MNHHKLCKRINTPGDAHELNFSCFKNRSFLNYDLTRNYLAEAITAARDKHKFHLWAYVFMPNHVHLLIWPTEEPYSISAILTSIKQSVALMAFIHLRKNDPEKLKYFETGQKHIMYRFWQDGGGYDRNLTTPDIILNVVEYIHTNPVRGGLVDNPLDWYWSSARQWEGREEGPVRIDKESFPVK